MCATQSVRGKAGSAFCNSVAKHLNEEDCVDDSFNTALDFDKRHPVSYQMSVLVYFNHNHSGSPTENAHQGRFWKAMTKLTVFCYLACSSYLCVQHFMHYSLHGAHRVKSHRPLV